MLYMTLCTTIIGMPYKLIFNLREFGILLDLPNCVKFTRFNFSRSKRKRQKKNTDKRYMYSIYHGLQFAENFQIHFCLKL